MTHRWKRMGLSATEWAEKVLAPGFLNKQCRRTKNKRKRERRKALSRLSIAHREDNVGAIQPRLATVGR